MKATVTPCPLCSATDHELVYDLSTARSADDVPGHVVRCHACGMWFKILNQPQAIPTAYVGEYGHDELAQTYLLGDAARTLFRQALAQVQARAPGRRLRLLDIGAGQGVLLEEATRLGFDAEGIDHCEENVRDALAKDLRVKLAAAEQLDYEAAFDVVTMMDIIEHLPDPMRVLRLAHRALKGGGEVVVYTPNHRGAVVVLAKLLYALGVRYPVQEIFGRNHVCFFDDRTLTLALSRVGFSPLTEQLFPYDPSRPGQYVSPLNLAAVTAVERLGRPCKRVFRLLLHARRSE